MDVAEVRAELEEELSRRLEDIRFFRNKLSDMEDDDSQSRYCKCLVVMLYAHFEGFWKAAFSIYLKTINSEGVQCSDAIEEFVAASMHDLFQALANPNSKSDFFRRTAPDDTKLHRFARHKEFAGSVETAFASVVEIPVDDLVDTESNLTPVVVKKILFRLGFSHEEFKSEEGTIQQLLRRRNDIAHGSARGGVPVNAYTDLESAVISVMKRVVLLIFESLNAKSYLKPPATAPAATA